MRDMMRLVLAARLSQLNRDGSRGIGLDTQDIKARDWAEHEGHVIVGTAADTRSGTVAPWDRPRLRAWVTEPSKMAQYDGVLAYATDRLSRGTQEDFTRIEAWATENHKFLVIVDGPMYPARDDADYWRWTAEKRSARVEWEKIRERNMRTQGALRDAGKLVGKPPFGYVSSGSLYDKTMVPTEVGRKYVPQMFGRYTGGASFRDIAKWLDSEGIPSATGKKWSAESVSKVIKNTSYMGFRKQGETILEVEPLVDAQTFRLAQEASKTRVGRRSPANPANKAMLQSVIFCPDCGSPMYKKIAGNPKVQVPIPYYRCHGKPPERESCGNMVRMSKVDATVDAIVHASFTGRVTVEKHVPGHNHEAAIEAVKYQMKALPVDLPDAAYDAELDRLRGERDRLAGLPTVPDRTETVELDYTYADRWDALEPSQRGAWLSGHGFRVEASKTSVRVTKGVLSGFVNL
jgi:site-specific DNA recombinase